MAENAKPKIESLTRRAKVPGYIRLAAVGVAMVVVLAVFVGFYFESKADPFRIKPEHAKLSKDVIAEVNGYERLETEGDIKKYFLKADKATTFSDNHQELENVYLQVFDDAGQAFDQITADKAIYIPGESKNFDAYFAGRVNIETRQGLKVKTEQIHYNRANETAEAEELVEFERGGIAGTSLGAFVRIREKRLELMKDVTINAFALSPDDEMTQNRLEHVKLTSNYAMIDQESEQAELSDNVFVSVTPAPGNDGLAQPAEMRSQRAVAIFENREIRRVDLSGGVDVYQKPTDAVNKWTRTKSDVAKVEIRNEVKSVELNGNVEIQSASGDQPPTVINSEYAFYEKDADRFRLERAVRIVTHQNSKPVRISGAAAVYAQTAGVVNLTGGAEIDNGTEFLRGETLTANLLPDRKLRNATVRGGSYLRQATAERTAEVWANEMNAAFGPNQQLSEANASGDTKTVLVPARPEEYSRVSMSAPRAVHLRFREGGILERMDTDGRTTIDMTAPAGREDAANKKLIADEVKTVLQPNGRDLSRAEAIGNAELQVLPLKASPGNYRTTINAPRFDCEFYPTGNSARACVAGVKTKTVRVPTIPAERRGTQTLLSERMTAQFDQNSQDVSHLDATGGARFTELDRNAIADSLSFTGGEEIVRLRGGEPTVWDSAARARADEIDWDTKNGRSFLRGNVSTTYYSQKQTNGATPFGQTNKPVYVTSANAEFDHTAETGLYTGNARAWQEKNFVRSDSLLLRQREGQLIAEGSVQSALYDAKKKEKGRESSVPAYASADKLTYNRDSRTLRYERNVDIRQATDRITAGRADIFLNDRNELSKTIAETNVVLTQPNRKAVGDWVQYTADNEIAILRGNPARIEDAENGSTQGAQVTVYMRENRFVGESESERTTSGRTRTVYKVKKND